MDDAFVLGGEGAEEGGIGMTAHGNDIVNGGIVDGKAFRQNQCNRLCRLLHRQTIVAAEGRLQVGKGT